MNTKKPVRTETLSFRFPAGTRRRLRSLAKTLAHEHGEPYSLTNVVEEAIAILFARTETQKEIEP